MDMQNQNESITIRIDEELYSWLKQQAAIKNCKISDLVRESIITFKKVETIPDGMLFSSGLHIKAAKAALMTYRLTEMLAHELIENGNDLIKEASKRAKEDINEWKIG